MAAHHQVSPMDRVAYILTSTDVADVSAGAARVPARAVRMQWQRGGARGTAPTPDDVPTTVRDSYARPDGGRPVAARAYPIVALIYICHIDPQHTDT